MLNQNRQTSMHALLMRGDTCDVGGVACLKHVRNPIRAARLVMDHVSVLYVFTATGSTFPSLSVFEVFQAKLKIRSI